MKFETYLHFDGDCEQAFKFYEQCFRGKIEAMLTYADAPAQDQRVPAEWRNKVMHSRLVIGDQAILGMDAPPGYSKEPQGFSVAVMLNEPAEGERLFHALEQGGTVRMPIQQTFWATRFGMLTDRFGTPWMISCTQAAERAA